MIYARFSPRPGDGEAETIDVQIAKCQQYAKNSGRQVCGIHVDKMMSGAQVDRPGLWDAIEDIRPGMWLMVACLDRLARNVHLSALIEREIEKRKGRIISVAGEGTWRDTPQDALIRNIVRAFNQYEREMISFRTRAVLQSKKAKGQRVGTIAFGKRLKIGSTHDLEDDPQEQFVISELKAMREMGMVAKDIEKQAAAMGFRTRSGGMIKASWVSRLLNRIGDEEPDEDSSD